MWDFLFGKNKDQYNAEYDKAIKDTKQSKAEAEYNYRYNKALYDANKDYFDKMGVKDPSASYWNENGQKTNALMDTMNQYDKYLGDLNKEKEDVAWKNRYNIFGDGLIGGLLNPFHQAGTAVQDFVSSGTKEWDNGNRDVLSDLGAIGESALTVAPLAGGLLKTGSGVAKAGAKSLGKTMLKGAGYGAGFGALGGITDMGAKNFDLGQLALNAGIGAGFGGGLSGLGYGIGKIGDRYASRAQNTRTLQDLYKQYQNSGTITANALGDGVGGTSATTAQQNPAVEWLLNRDDLAKTKAGQVVQGIKDTISYNKMMGNSPVNKIKNVTNKVTNSKVGNNVANLLKTKKGKVLLGGSAGLTLAGLMKNRNDNNTGQISDEEMQELYNYVYGGQ